MHAAVQQHLADARLVARADLHAAAPVRAARHRLDALAIDLDPGVVVALPQEVAAAADRPQHAVEEHLRQRAPEQVSQRERELVDAHVVVFPVVARFAQRAALSLPALGRFGVVRHAPVVLHLVGHAETFALPFAGLRKQVLPGDRAVVLRIETDAGQPVAHALAGREQPARVRNAREQREVGLGDAERLVRAIGFAPGGDFLAAHTDDTGDAAAWMHRPAQAVERRRVIVVDAPARGVGGRIARPRNLVRLRKADGLVELLHDAHDSQRHHTNRQHGPRPADSGPADRDVPLTWIQEVRFVPVAAPKRAGTLVARPAPGFSASGRPRTARRRAAAGARRTGWS